MLRTSLCHRVGIEYPIFSVGMGTAAGPELTAAVSMREPAVCSIMRVCRKVAARGDPARACAYRQAFRRESDPRSSPGRADRGLF